MGMKADGKNDLKAARNRLLKILKKILQKKSGKAREEFRYNVKTGHKAYVISVDEWADIWIALGLTSSHETGGVKNMPLLENPQNGKTAQSYIRNGEIVGEHKHFGRQTINMKFSPKDIPNVKAKKRNAKKNAKQRKKDNKKRK